MIYHSGIKALTESAYDFSYDISGEGYKDVIHPGPVASLKAGKRKICVWKK